MSHRTATKTSPTLDGKTSCANCGAAMHSTSGRYHCPNTTVESTGECTTTPVNAKHLLRTVVEQMVKRLATEERIESITRTIKDSTLEGARIQRARIERAETAIAEATAGAGAGAGADNTPEEAAQRDRKLDLATAGFALEATAARDALDMIEFIGDASGLRETIKDPETYMSGDMDQEAQQLLDLLIQKVTVDNERTTIVYHMPLPADGAPNGITQDTVPMGTASRSGYNPQEK